MSLPPEFPPEDDYSLDATQKLRVVALEAASRSVDTNGLPSTGVYHKVIPVAEEYLKWLKQ